MSSFATNTLFAAFAIVVLHSEAQAASAEQCGSGSTRGRLRKRNLKYVKAAPRQEPSGKA